MTGGEIPPPADLLQRLAQAEATIEMLKAGRTDGAIGSAEHALQRITADLVQRTKALEQQAAVLTEQAALLDLAPDAIVVRDMAGRILFWNRGAELMYGWLSAEALGQITGDLLRTEFSQPLVDREAQFLREGWWEGEVIQYARDGRRLNVTSRWALQRDGQGVPFRILSINNNINERKRTETDLRVLSERLSLATAVAEVGVWEWDVVSDTLTWDATLFAMYRLEPKTPMEYAEWAAMVHSEDLPMVEATLKRAIEEKDQPSALVAEFRIILADGSIRNISAVERAVLDDHGNVSRVVGVNVDVTRRKQAEAELRTAKDAAESANRAKSEFLANMSHEIRTPMNGVIGMIDLVLDTELSGEQREYLLIVKSSADALLTIINDILDFSRVEAGKLDLDPIDFHLRDSIGDTAKTVALRAFQKGLELIVDVATDVPQTLRGDPGRLRQILVNLLGNAIKFTLQGEIVLRVVREPSTSPGIVLHFSVTDTGVGIPLARQKSVFEAFTQADGSVTRTYGGAGLGLTISSQLVGLMGGRLWVESAAGQGSTFHFTVCFAAAHDQPLGPDPPDVVDLRGLRVLIVDDNATNRQLLGEILSGWQMRPTIAASVREALTTLGDEQHAGKRIDLVVTDVRMPEADGFALAAAIRRDPALAGTTIVMLTSDGQPGDAARCRDLGILAYLPKPVKRSELRAAILLALNVRSSDRAGPALVTRHSLREARRTGRILLVEDNSVNQLVARRLLEKRGHDVVVATNGREALALLDDRTTARFGCVLMDVQMPEMDGLECTAVIRERERTTGEHLPIVAMTASAMEGDDLRCLEAGMDGYLTKPIQPDALFDLVEHHLAGAARAAAHVTQPPHG